VTLCHQLGNSRDPVRAPRISRAEAREREREKGERPSRPRDFRYGKTLDSRGENEASRSLSKGGQQSRSIGRAIAEATETRGDIGIQGEFSLCD